MAFNLLPDEAGSGSNDDFEFADVMGRVSLPTQLGDTTQSGFMMNTCLNVPSITATLGFETNVLNPSNILARRSNGTSRNRARRC